MEYIGVLLIAALVFGICFLLDKGFTKAFRGKAQHKSGKSVRVNKRYGSIGAIVIVLGVAAVLSGLKSNWLLCAGGGVLIVTGVCLAGYYLTFGIYYDEDSFLVSRFGKPDKVCSFGDIQSQQLYTASGNTVVELTMADGFVFQVQAGMEGMYAFMDHAFSAWLRQRGLRQDDCPYYDPQNSCWFPTED